MSRHQRSIALSLILLSALMLACVRTTATPDIRATEVVIGRIVRGTLTALAPTVTAVPTPTEIHWPTSTRWPSKTRPPTATRQPPTPRPLQVYYLWLDDYVRIAEPYVLQNTYPPCRVIMPYTRDPSKAYYFPGFEPGGLIAKEFAGRGDPFDPELFRFRVVPVECW